VNQAEAGIRARGDNNWFPRVPRQTFHALEGSKQGRGPSIAATVSISSIPCGVKSHRHFPQEGEATPPLSDGNGLLQRAMVQTIVTEVMLISRTVPESRVIAKTDVIIEFCDVLAVVQRWSSSCHTKARVPRWDRCGWTSTPASTTGSLRRVYCYCDQPASWSCGYVHQPAREQ
jgi:hypothetical protein